MYNFERTSRYILYEVEASHHLISIRLYFILTILITEDGSRSYFFLIIATQLVFFSLPIIKWKKNIYHTVGKVPAFNRKIVEICKFDIPNTHINDPSWLVQVLQ
jgi:hypothetical protein